ncbi:hypothetical protein, partial [Thiocystis violacea]|uniref:hypothetical protein n=1 Tax=Thiocystis violacea TaxID=13725 RepID=UPI001906D319
YPFVCRPQLLAQPPFRGPIRPRPGAIRVAEMNSGIAICQEDVAASFRSRIQVIYFAAVISVLLFSVIYIAVIKAKHDGKARIIEATAGIVGSIDIGNHDKRLLLTALGKSIIDQSNEKKDEL